MSTIYNYVNSFEVKHLIIFDYDCLNWYWYLNKERAYSMSYTFRDCERSG